MLRTLGAVRAPSLPVNLSPSVRFGLYAAVVVAVGSWLNFVRLGEGMLLFDEASFAYTTDSMLRTGEFVALRITENGYHLNAAPLYNWLSCLTADWGWPGEMRYRVWAAVFGVLCGVATLGLGAVLFSPEVGCVAALVLLLNRNFLYIHGMRFGGMESGTVFFVTSMLACYARTHWAGSRDRVWWALSGVFLGGAVLVKPPAFAGLMFVLMCAHNAVTRRDLSVRLRVLRPALALVAAGVVAGPWYAAVTAKVGLAAPMSLFFGNSIGRAATSQPWADLPRTFYLDVVLSGSRTFKWLPYLVAGAAVAVVTRGPGRLGFGLLLWLAGAFLVPISLSATKHWHYCYCVLPLLSVLAAAVLLIGLGAPPRTDPWFRRGWHVLGGAGLVAAVALIHGDTKHDSKHDSARLMNERHEYPPLALHNAMAAPLAAGRVRLTAVGYPDGTTARNPGQAFTENDAYYHQFRLPYCTRPEKLGEVNAALTDGVPTVVFLEPVKLVTDPVAVRVSAPPDRYALLRSGAYFYPVLTFHGAERACDLEAVFRKHAVTDAAAPAITVAH